MFSPALAHRQKKLAELSTRAHLDGMAARAGAAPPMVEQGPVATEYQSLLAQLHEDLRRLHDIQSRDAKVALKRTLIETYRPWVEGALAIAEGAAAPQDEIVISAFIWALDIRDWDLAIRLGAHVIAHGLVLPERFHRTAGGLLVSEMADAALAEPGAVARETLIAARPGEGPGWDMKNETRARLERAIGESWARDAETFDPAAESAPAGGKAMMVAAALDAFREAMRLDAKVGVKKQVEVLEREAKKLAEAAGVAQPGQPAPASPPAENQAPPDPAEAATKQD